MVLPDNVYKILKAFCTLIIPSFTTAYVGLAKIWSFPYPTQIAETSAIICTLIGALIGISSSNYYMAKDEAKAE